MNLSPVSPSRHYLACTVCAVPFVGSVSVDSRMKPLTAITLHIAIRLLLLADSGEL